MVSDKLINIFHQKKKSEDNLILTLNVYENRFWKYCSVIKLNKNRKMTNAPNSALNYNHLNEMIYPLFSWIWSVSDQKLMNIGHYFEHGMNQTWRISEDYKMQMMTIQIARFLENYFGNWTCCTYLGTYFWLYQKKLLVGYLNEYLDEFSEDYMRNHWIP